MPLPSPSAIAGDVQTEYQPELRMEPPPGGRLTLGAFIPLIALLHRRDCTRKAASLTGPAIDE